MRFLIAAALGLSATFASAAGRPPPVLEPSSKWVVDYSDNSCRLARMFGTDKDAVKIVFEQLAPRSTMTVMVIGKVHARAEDNVLAFEPLPDVRIGGGIGLDVVNSNDSSVFWPRRLGRGRWGLISDALADGMWKADPAAAEASQGAPSDRKAAHVKWEDHDWSVESEDQWRQENAGFAARAGEVTAVVLNPGHSGSVSLHTGELAKPLQALEQCASDSLKDFGIDPAVQATVATGAHPVVNGQTLFSSSDYPVAAARQLQEDNFSVWLNIDAQGGIAGCRVISHFATPSINEAICGMIRKKERFVPARTKDGKPVPDFFIQSFVFKMQ